MATSSTELGGPWRTLLGGAGAADAALEPGLADLVARLWARSARPWALAHPGAAVIRP